MTVISSPNAAQMPSGLLGLLVQDSAAIQSRVTTTSQQASTGLVAQTYGGLGAQAQVSLNLRPELAQVDVYAQNITTASTQMDSTNQVLGQLEQIASQFRTSELGVSTDTAQEVDTLASQASAALTQVQSLLNTKVGDKYIFAGQDSANPPLPDTQFNAYVASIRTAMGGLAAGTGAATVAATLAAATTNSPFSTTLGTTPGTASVGVGVTVPVGVVAGQNAYVSQTGPNTTGSYVRDLIRSLATIAAMNSSQTTLGADFTTVVSNTQSSLASQVVAISNEQAGIGAAQQTLTNTQTALGDTKTALTTQISAVENVDAASTATALTQAQTQLQISYKIISSMQTMSLVSFL